MKNIFAKILFEIEAVKVSPNQPFQYASGLIGPIYCDNRILLAYPEQREKIIEGLINLANQINYDAFAGLATAGIPHAAMMADRLQMPMCYVRSKPKEHGKGNQVEGFQKMGSSVLIVEDLVNQASSLKNSYHGIIQSGLKCSNAICIVDYQTSASKRVLQDLALELSSLVNFHDILSTAKELKIISDTDILNLQEWHVDPEKWSMTHRS